MCGEMRVRCIAGDDASKKTEKLGDGDTCACGRCNEHKLVPERDVWSCALAESARTIGRTEEKKRAV